MENKQNALKEYSSGALFKAAIGNLLAKKSVRLTVSIIAVVVSLIAINKLSEYYSLGSWWQCFLAFFPFFLVFTVGMGGFISSIGKFTARKFITASTVSSAALWIVMAVFNALFFTIDWPLLLYSIALELLAYISLPVVSSAVVIAVTLSVRRKCNS